MWQICAKIYPVELCRDIFSSFRWFSWGTIFVSRPTTLQTLFLSKRKAQGKHIMTEIGHFSLSARWLRERNATKSNTRGRKSVRSFWTKTRQQLPSNQQIPQMCFLTLKRLNLTSKHAVRYCTNTMPRSSSGNSSTCRFLNIPRFVVFLTWQYFQSFQNVLLPGDLMWVNLHTSLILISREEQS